MNILQKPVYLTDLNNVQTKIFVSKRKLSLRRGRMAREVWRKFIVITGHVQEKLVQKIHCRDSI